MKAYFYFFILLIGLNCQHYDCEDIKQHFNAYNEAIAAVRNAHFRIHETIDLPSSSWLTEANYYSCDGQAGYFIFRTNADREYIHKDMPIEIWNQFKNAESKGSYYVHNIKHKYQLFLE